MLSNTPRFLLQADALFPTAECGEWRFVLTDQVTGQIIAASDAEPDTGEDRLALMALVRGLEAIPHPARVTLLTSSRSVRDGLRSGLASWKSNAWKWERFGRLVTIRDHDLWRRVDQALQIHRAVCRSWRLCGTDLAGLETTSDHSPYAASFRRCRQNPSQNAAISSPNQPSYEPRLVEVGPASFMREPALLVVRNSAKRNRLRMDQPSVSSSRYAQASAC